MKDEGRTYQVCEDGDVSDRAERLFKAMEAALVKSVMKLERFHDKPFQKGQEWVAGWLWKLSLVGVSRPVAELQLTEEARQVMRVLWPRLWTLSDLTVGRGVVIAHVAMLFGTDALLAQRDFWRAMEARDYEAAHDILFLNQWAELTGHDPVAIKRTLTLARVLRTGDFPERFL
jgi:hypothetical protein